MKTEHTKTPWVLHRNIGKKSALGIVADDAPCIIATMGNQRAWPKEAQANATFIVRACNHHEKLVNALRSVIELDTPSEGMGGDWGTLEWMEQVGHCIEIAKQSLSALEETEK